MILIGTTSCSNKSDDEAVTSGGSSPTAPASGTTTSAGPSNTSSRPEEKLPDLSPAQVVAALTGKNFKCSTDEAYETCSQGTTSVQVLLGNQPRPAVLSLHATGIVEEATAQLTEFTPQALEIAHVNPRGQIADWLRQQQGKSAAQTTAGNWTVEFSTEVDSEQPGAILTLTDKLCTVNCGAE